MHKGILELLQAVDLLDDRRVRVGAFQTRELEELRKQIGSLERWIVPVPFHAFDELPSVLAAADLAVALQSPEHPVSRYQMPAKVTDAMAMGVPCLVTPVPPLQPLIDKDVLEVFDGDTPLHRRLADILAHPDDAIDRARQARELFLESFSYEVVRPVVAAAIERHLDDPPAIGPGLESIVGVARELYRPTTAVASRPSAAARPPRRPMPPGSSYDLVVFWKQNDTGIYGRRQDMFLKYLERSGRFEKILHFDHPMSVEGLLRTAQRGIGSADQNRLVVQQTLRRMTHRADRGAVRSRTFVYGAGRVSRRIKLPRSSRVREVRPIGPPAGTVRRGPPCGVLGVPDEPVLPGLRRRARSRHRRRRRRRRQPHLVRPRHSGLRAGAAQLPRPSSNEATSCSPIASPSAASMT